MPCCVFLLSSCLQMRVYDYTSKAVTLYRILLDHRICYTIMGLRLLTLRKRFEFLFKIYFKRKFEKNIHSFLTKLNIRLVKTNTSLISVVHVIANFCSWPLLSFGQAPGKLQGKVVTHSEEVGWWRTLMVECVTLFWLFSVYGTTDWPSFMNLLYISNNYKSYLKNHIQADKPRHSKSY